MDTLQSIIARIPAWEKACEVNFERIAGLINANYLITVDGERFVLRVSGQNTGKLGINRSHELAALQAAEVEGLGPEVIAFLLPEGHLVTKWVDGRHWDVNEFGELRLIWRQHGGMKYPFHLDMKYMLMLFTGLWGLAQHGMQQAGLVPAVEGFDYYEFTKYLFTHDIQELHAQYFQGS